jgi:hypothetical protein
MEAVILRQTHLAMVVEMAVSLGVIRVIGMVTRMKIYRIIIDPMS